MYSGRMDNECVALCDAINRIPGVETTESCCGHARSPYRIWFCVTELTHLPILLYYLDPCHVGFRWHCEAKTDCAMSPVTFFVGSGEYSGEVAYKQAKRIAECINECMDRKPHGIASDD